MTEIEVHVMNVCHAVHTGISASSLEPFVWCTNILDRRGGSTTR